MDYTPSQRFDVQEEVNCEFRPPHASCILLEKIPRSVHTSQWVVTEDNQRCICNLCEDKTLLNYVCVRGLCLQSLSFLYLFVELGIL